MADGIWENMAKKSIKDCYLKIYSIRKKSTENPGKLKKEKHNLSLLLWQRLNGRVADC